MGINFQNGKRIVVDLSDLHFPSFDEENELSNGLVVDLIEIDGVWSEQTLEGRNLKREMVTEDIIIDWEGLRKGLLSTKGTSTDNDWIRLHFFDGQP